MTIQNSLYKKSLYIVITDFNGCDQTSRCLEALRNSEYQDFSTIVVDHGTNQATRIFLEREFPNVFRLLGSPQLWWAGATNLGIRFALKKGATEIMLLNNDCYVPPETIEKLVQLSLTKPDAIIAPVQRDWHTSSVISIKPATLFLLGFPTRPGPRTVTSGMLAQPLQPTRLIGGGRGVIIPKSVFDKIGLLREDIFPHYCADHDFYLNCARQKIELFIASEIYVDVDNTRTTLADDPQHLDFRQFIETLSSIRSHRNIKDVKALFKRHYPINGLYWIGVTLYLTRYIVVYTLKRAALKIKNRISGFT